MKRKILLKAFLPVTLSLKKLLKLDYEAIVSKFVEINNECVFKSLKNKPKKIMLLMPHCLQFSDCDYRVTGKEIKCKRCGRCEINDLINLSEEFGVKLSIASGGTMARNIIKEFSPDLIIATACERDLISGLKDTLALPVIGILNERPNGPCNDTRVDINKIRTILKNFKEVKNEK